MTESYSQILKQANQAVAAAAAKIGDDPHRPIYHLMTRANWINDPNGPVYYDGFYHMFFQHNPRLPDFGPIGWGHARSPDLVHWQHCPIAMMPTPGSYDGAGVWSGSVVIHNGTPTMMYSAVANLDLHLRDEAPPQSDRQQIPQGYSDEYILEVDRETQCIATSADGLQTWQKHPANPVIASPPPGLDWIGFRDPFLWKEDDERWYMVLGSGIKGQGGAALLYRSPDLIDWEYLNPLYMGSRRESGINWECPNFLDLGDKHMLVVSPHSRPLYWLGDYANHQFSPDGAAARLDGGDVFYAPNSLRDPSGRWLMWGWIREARSRAQYVKAGWASCLTLPREIALGENNRLTVRPAAELRQLRKAARFEGDVSVSAEESDSLGAAAGDCLEISCRVTEANCEQLGIQFRRTPDGEEQAELVYDFQAGELRLVRERSTNAAEVTVDPCQCELALAEGEALDLTIYLDKSVIEIYANERLTMTSRIYPTRKDALGLHLFTLGGAAKAQMTIWEMGSIWV